MIPPSFGDLGKAAKDLFEKNFVFGSVKTEHKFKSDTGVEVTTNGCHNNDTGKVSGSLQGKHKQSAYGTAVTVKWNTNNVLTGEISLENKILDGLKQTLDMTFEPNTGKKSARVKNEYQREYFHANADLDFQASLPIVNIAKVFGYKGYVAGFQLGVDSGAQKLQKFNYAMGYMAKDFTFTGTVANQAQDFGASVHQRLSDRLETAVQVGWNRGNAMTRYSGAVKCTLSKNDKDFVKLRMDNAFLIGLGYSFLVRPGVQMTLSAQLDGHNMNAGGHKLGLSIDFES